MGHLDSRNNKDTVGATEQTDLPGQSPVLPKLPPPDNGIGAKETPEDKRRATLARRAESIVTSSVLTAAPNSARALEVVLQIVRSLPESQATEFVNFSLKNIVRRQGNFLSVETFEALLRCHELTAVASALPLLLRALPRLPISMIFDRLETIGTAAGTARKGIFATVVPNLLNKAGDDFNDDIFRTFQFFCVAAKRQSLVTCSSYFASFNHPTLSSVSIQRRLEILTVPFERKVELPKKFLSFYFDICHRIEGRVEDPMFLLGQLVEGWRVWSTPDPVPVSQHLLKVFGSLQQTPKVRTVLALLKQSSSLFAPTQLQPKSGEIVENLDSTGEWIRRFGPNHITQVGDLLALAYRNGRRVGAEHVLNTLLETFSDTSRIGNHLPFISSALSRFSEGEFERLLEELPQVAERSLRLLLSQGAIEDTPLNYLLTRIIAGGAEIFNPYPIDERTFHSRYTEQVSRSRAPSVIVHTGHRFSLPATTSGNEMIVTQGAVPELGFIGNSRRRFTLPDSQAQRENLAHIATLVPDGERILGTKFEPRQVLALIAAAAKGRVPSNFDRIVKMSLPFLATANGTRLPHLPDDLSLASPTEIFDYLETLRLLIDDRLPLTLESEEYQVANRERIETLKRIAYLPQISAELRKFKQNVRSEMWEISLTSSKNVIDSFYDLSAETCIFEKCGNELDSELFQPIRMVAFDRFDVLGSWYVTRGVVRGVPSLVMAGGGPRRSALKALSLCDLVTVTIAHMKQIAEENDLSGGVYQAVGKPAPGRGASSWTDEGRIAQHPDLRRALVPKGAQVIELSEEEHVHFPARYGKGPIQRVVRLA